MNNLSSYCGLVDVKIRASDKVLPVCILKKSMRSYSIQPFRVEAILDIAKDAIHVFTSDGAAWEDMEVQLDTQRIDFADVVYEAGDSRYINHKSTF